MVDRDVVEQGLAALSLAIGELLEDEQVEAVSALPGSPSAQRNLFRRLKQTGEDVAALATAAEVLVRHKAAE